MLKVVTSDIELCHVDFQSGIYPYYADNDFGYRITDSYENPHIKLDLEIVEGDREDLASIWNLLGIPVELNLPKRIPSKE